MKRDHHKVILPKLCSALCLIASASLDDHWWCQVPETRTTLHGMPQWLFWWMCHFWGWWPTLSGEVHSSMVSVRFPSLNLLQAAPVTGMMRVTGVLWAIPLLASENHEGGAWERSGTWRSLLSPSEMMPSGHTEAGQHIAFWCQTTSTSSKAHPATGTLTFLLGAVFGKSIVSNHLCWSPVQTEKRDRFSVYPVQGCMCFSIIFRNFLWKSWQCVIYFK